MRSFAVLGSLSAVVLVGCSEYQLSGKVEPQDPPLETDVTDPPEVLVPEITLNRDHIDFGFLPKECTADREDLVVTNDGEAPLEIGLIDIVGPDASVYRHLGRSRTLAPHESYTIQSDFTPTAWRQYDDAALRIESNDPDEPRVQVPYTGASAEEAFLEDLFEVPSTSGVDVLWVIDNSGSMSGEVGKLADDFGVFIDRFVTFGLDYHIAVVTTDMDDPAQAGLFRGPVITPNTPNPTQEFRAQAAQGSSGSGDERGRDAAYAALTSPLIDGPNAGFLRPGLPLAIIVITDENDSSTTSKNLFTSWLNGVKGDPLLTSYNALAGPETGFFPCITFFAGVDAEPAPGYAEVVRATGGLYASICHSSMDTFLTAMANAAIGVLSTYSLRSEVLDPSGIIVTVDGREVPADADDGYTYDAATNSVTLHGDATPNPGDDVLVQYQGVPICPN
jgi:hypothetical protein